MWDGCGNMFIAIMKRAVEHGGGGGGGGIVI